MSPLQEGIYHAKGKRPGKFFAIAFLRAGEKETSASCAACLEALWTMWQELKEGRVGDLSGQEVPHGDLSVLLGLGPKAFRFDDRQRELPDGLGPHGLFKPPRGSGGGPLVKLENQLNYADEVRENRADEEFAVQFIANSKLAVDRAIVETWKLLSARKDPGTGVAELDLTNFYLGFQRDDHRSWIDFHDGISNLPSTEREQIITIGRGEAHGDAWLEGGTYLAFLRVEVDLEIWRSLDREQQELIVGRDKLTGCPLVAENGRITPRPGCPVANAGIWESENDPIAEPPTATDPRLLASHVQRANHHGPPGDRRSLRIFRQGYEFMEWKESSPGFRLGLNFVSFQDTTTRLIAMLSQPGWLGDVNFGGASDPAKAPPGMDRFLRVYASGVYLVPPTKEGERFPGSEAFAAGEVPAGAGR
jgi:hypothetical protein